jgi:hypothetical protein
MALMVSAADTAPGLMARHGAMTNALINPALRTLREKLIDIAVSFDFELLSQVLLSSTGTYLMISALSGHSDFPPV